MRPFSLLIKPAGPDCNIDCKYCFYSCKSEYFADSKHRMSDEVLETLIKDYLSLGFAQNSFAWQGGEPTLMGLDFYKRVVQLQEKYCGDSQIVSNSLQTNAILLDEQWCEFLSETNWLLGISLDGPEKYHDHYRKNFASEGTYQSVFDATELCRKHHVEFNILTLLNDRNVDSPDELFDYFVENKFKYLQFIPCVEVDPENGEIRDFSITPKQYGEFLCKIFDRWYAHGPEKISIRIIDSLMNKIVRGVHTNCSFGRSCSDYIVVEHNGDAFCCDFFVDEEFRLGNISQTPIEALAGGEIKREFAAKKNQLGNKCFLCRYCDLCRGGCPKERLILGDDYKQPSYLCQAYKMFFEHAMPRLYQLSASVMP